MSWDSSLPAYRRVVVRLEAERFSDRFAGSVGELLAVTGAVERFEEAHGHGKRPSSAEQSHDILHSRLVVEPADLFPRSTIIDGHRTNLDVLRGKIGGLEQGGAERQEMSARAGRA